MNDKLYQLQRRLDRVTQDLNNFDQWADHYLMNYPDQGEYVKAEYQRLIKESEELEQQIRTIRVG